MEKRSQTLKNVCEAIYLDGSGFHQAAFAKYLQSLQALSLYLNDLYNSSGFGKMLEKKREVKHVLSVIHECSDRIAVIIDTSGNAKETSISEHTFDEANSPSTHQNSSDNLIHTKFPAFEKMRNENMLIFKKFQSRLERAPDKYTKANLRLELQRRLAENFDVAKSKYALAVKQQQKERLEIMEHTMKRLFEKGRRLNEKELEKKELYSHVLQYATKETWSCSLKCNTHDLPVFEAVKEVFQRTLRCSDHPISQWLILVQTKIKQEVDRIFKQHYQFVKYLPDKVLHSEKSTFNSFVISSSEISIKFDESEEMLSIPLDKLLSLQKELEDISFEIKSTIEDALQVFYLTYKSVLPEDSETICYKFMEKYFLHQLWPALITLFRVIYLPVEYKISETMFGYKSSPPSKFGFCVNSESQQTESYNYVIMQLKTLPSLSSLVEKFDVLVQVSQKLCVSSSFESENSEKKLMGADDFIPLLCYIIVQTGTSQLVSECYALEQLFDQKYMLGEEGYALSSFLTALKYLEMKTLMEEENLQPKSDMEN